MNSASDQQHKWTQALAELYARIHECTLCINSPGCKMQPDPMRVPRVIVERSLGSRVFVVGQVLGPRTQRLTGIPYMLESGELSRTGRALDDFLRRLGYTVDPSGSMKYAYFSDIVQRYPGPDPQGEGDRAPTSKEITNCAHWLEEELGLMQPDVVILLGKKAARSFLRTYSMNRAQFEYGAEYPVKAGGKMATAFAIYHPSYRRRKPALVDALYAETAKRVSDVLRS